MIDGRASIDGILSGNCRQNWLGHDIVLDE